VTSTEPVSTTHEGAHENTSGSFAGTGTEVSITGSDDGHSTSGSFFGTMDLSTYD